MRQRAKVGLRAVEATATTRGLEVWPIPLPNRADRLQAGSPWLPGREPLMFAATRRYREDRRWLEALFGGGGGHVIRDQLPRPFAAYGRVFPPVKITHYLTPLVQRGSPEVRRWSELAALCGVDFTPATTWPDLERAICATGDHGLHDVGHAEIDNTVWDLSAARAREVEILEIDGDAPSMVLSEL